MILHLGLPSAHNITSLPTISHYLSPTYIHTSKPQKQQNSNTNYKKPRYNECTTSVENRLQSFNINSYSTTEVVIKHLNTTIQNADHQIIPTGNIRRYNSTFSRNIKHKIQTLRHLRILPSHLTVSHA